MTATRLIELLGLLQRGPRVKAKALARELGVHERTVRRDIARLETAGVRVGRSRGRHGGYWMGAAGSHPAATGGTGSVLGPFVFSADEAVAVAAALRSLMSRNLASRSATSRGLVSRSLSSRRLTSHDAERDARRAFGKLWRGLEGAERQRVRRLEVALERASSPAP